MYDRQRNYYLNKIRSFPLGSAQIVSWNNAKSQEIRFALLSKLFLYETGPATLLDIGCGVGDLSAYLKEHKFGNLLYSGIDALPEMIALAQKKYPHESFKTVDFSTPAFQETFDYLTACGVLNLLNGDSATEHLEYIKKFIKKMFGLANKGAALNLLSIKGKDLFEEDPLFYYADPSELLLFCRSFCPAATIESDYLPHDFTIYLPKN